MSTATAREGRLLPSGRVAYAGPAGLKQNSNHGLVWPGAGENSHEVTSLLLPFGLGDAALGNYRFESVFYHIKIKGGDHGAIVPHWFLSLGPHASSVRRINLR